MRRRIFIVAMTLFIIAVSAELCNRISFDPNFTMLDAVSSASKRAKRNQNKQENKDTEEWKFSYEDYALKEDDPDLKEIVIEGDFEAYQLLWKRTKEDKSYTLLVNQQILDSSPQIEEVQKLLQEEGYSVEIKECSEVLFASLIHEKKFDIVYMGKVSE